MQIIGLSGQARSGKNTVADFLTDQHGYAQVAFARPLKEMLHAGLNLDPNHFQTTEQKEAILPQFGVSYRQLAQTLGTEWGRSQNPNLWLILAMQEVNRLSALDVPGVVFTDMRFENEAELIREIGGVVWHLKSKRALSGMTAKAAAHASEAGVKVSALDRILDNDGDFQELFEKVINLLASCVFVQSEGPR